MNGNNQGHTYFFMIFCLFSLNTQTETQALTYLSKEFNVHYFVLDDGKQEPSTDISDMTEKSAKKIILTAFNVCDLQSLTMKKHLVPLSKVVNVKHWLKGKYQLLLPLAKKLVEAGHIKINVDDDKVNYRNLKPWAEMPDTSLHMVSNILKLPKQTWTPQFV